MFKSLPQPLYYAAGLVFMKGISFFMLPFIAKSLTPNEFGGLDVWLTVLNLGSILIGFGLIDALYKKAGDVNKYQLDTLLSTCLKLQIKIALVATLLGAIAMAFASLHWPALSMLDGALLLSTLVLGAVFNIPLTWLRLQDNARTFFALTSSKAFLQALLTLTFLTQGWGVTGVLLSGAISALLLTAVLLRLQLKNLQWQPDIALELTLLNYGKPLVVSGFLLFLATGAERWIIAGTIDLASVAVYAIAMQFAMMIALLCEPITLWWFPKRFIILAQQNGPQRTVAIAEGISHISLWLAMGMSVTAPSIIQLLFPQSYHAAIPLLPWLAMGVAFKQVSHVVNTGLYTKDIPSTVLKINAGMAVLALILFSIGSFKFGLTGVIGSFVILYAIRGIAFAIASQRVMKLPYDFRTLVSHTLLCLCAIWFAQDVQLVCWIAFAIQTLWIIRFLYGHVQRNRHLPNDQALEVGS